jgi:hypothetical protein
MADQNKPDRDDQSGVPAREDERVRGIAGDEEEFEDTDDLDEDEDQDEAEEGSTF